MSVRTRLKRIQRKRDQQVAPPLSRDATDEDWLEFFTHFAELGLLNNEQDFPRALAEYRQAIEATAKCDDPPFFPPDDYEPKLPRRSRLQSWRRTRRYPKVSECWTWLGEMFCRAVEGKPPVTEEEYAELTTWFEENFARIRELEEPSFSVVIDGHKIESRGNLHYWLTRYGPRADRAGETAQRVRLLRKKLGDG